MSAKLNAGRPRTAENIGEDAEAALARRLLLLLRQLAIPFPVDIMF